MKYKIGNFNLFHCLLIHKYTNNFIIIYVTVWQYILLLSTAVAYMTYFVKELLSHTSNMMHTQLFRGPVELWALALSLWCRGRKPSKERLTWTAWLLPFEKLLDLPNKVSPHFLSRLWSWPCTVCCPGICTGAPWCSGYTFFLRM